jgi:hypothetical protein
MVAVVAVVALIATVKTAVIVGLVGTFVGGTAPLRSIAPAFRLERPKDVVELVDFLQLVIPTKSIIARSNELRINICFLMTSYF